MGYTICMEMCLSGVEVGIRSIMLNAGFRSLMDLLPVNFAPCAVEVGEASILNAVLLIAVVHLPRMLMTKLVFESFFATIDKG